MPKVSVVIPAYNYGYFIGEAIDSVLNQTCKDLEIIVVNDGSTDSTEDVVRAYHGRVIYVKQVNQGVSSARNHGISLSNGKYVAFLDADDLWLPEKLERSVAYLEKNKLDWVCTARLKLDENGKYTRRRIEEESGMYDKESGVLTNLERGLFNPDYNLPFPSTILLRKECFTVAGLFEESLKTSEDCDLWMRFQEAGLTGGYLDEPLVIYRHHQKGLSRKSALSSLEGNIKVAKKHAKILKVDKLLRSEIYSSFWWDRAVSFYLINEKLRALKCAALSFLYYPRISKVTKLLKYRFNRAA